jgi:phosphoglycerol transferase MdoB-like AlkP superfamily enzyme
LDFSEANVAADGYFKDDALADVIVDKLDESDEPTFLFAVTIENHTLYENKYEETEVKVDSDKLNDSELHTLEQYSQGVLNADRFIAKMVDYVENAQRPTILYVWGDHLPSLSAFGTLGYIEDNYNKYSTPLVAYSNYKDIEIGEDYITPNQLAPQILKDAEIDYSDYFDFIYSLREAYPVIQKEFGVPAEDEEIKKYELVQYDVLFGKGYLLEGK